VITFHDPAWSHGVSWWLFGCRYVGLAKTRLQHVFTVVAINLVRVAEWCAGTPVAKTRRSCFAALHMTV